MVEKEFLFTEIISREGSGDLKHAVLEERYGRSDLLPLWVADMDFATPPFIIEALRERLEHPILGYTAVPDALWEAIIRWMAEHHRWQLKREWIAFVPGVVKGIGMAVNVFTQPGDKVIIQPPVYHPFRIVPEGNGRKVVMNPLRRSGDTYEMDFEQLESIADERCKMLILSNPHNPAGIVWPEETLRRLAEICSRRGIIVVSDEIHSDMALFSHVHTPFAAVSKEAADISITFGAPSKTFNMAGVVSSWAVVPNDSLRRRLFTWMNANEFDDPHLFAPIATIAALTKGEAWRKEMLRAVERNVLFVEDFCKEHIPQIRPMRPQASFLVWLDCRRLGLDHEQLLDLFTNRARLALNDGEMFGPGGEGFMRLNVAAPQTVINEALGRLESAVASLP